MRGGRWMSLCCYVVLSVVGLFCRSGGSDTKLIEPDCMKLIEVMEL